MRFNRLAGVRVLFNLVSFVASTLAPTFAYSQALTLLQSGTRYAGTITPGFNGDFGSATTVSLNTPSYIVFDSQGNQYLSDTQNNCVRKIGPSGSMSTVVGLAVSGQGDTCSTASNSTPTPSQGLYQPTGLAVDNSNNLYIADSKHNCVRMLANGASGVARANDCRRHLRLRSFFYSQPQRTRSRRQQQSLHLRFRTQRFFPPSAPTRSSARLQVRASALWQAPPPRLFRIPAQASPATVALNAPSGLAISGTGDLFIADTGNNCVRQIANLTTYKTAVGQCSNDSSGTLTTALNKPYGLTFSPTQSLVHHRDQPGQRRQLHPRIVHTDDRSRPAQRFLRSLQPYTGWQLRS